MDPKKHTLGAKCRLAPLPRADHDDNNDDELPPIDAQYFYSSLVPIDDPPSTRSAAGASDARSVKGQLRPFAPGDNNALELAWLGLASDADRQRHNASRNRLEDTPAEAKACSNKREKLVDALARKHWDRHRRGFQPQDLSFPDVDAQENVSGPICCSELRLDVSEELQRVFCAIFRNRNPSLDSENITQDVIAAIIQLRQVGTESTGTLAARPNRSRPTSSTGPSAPLVAPEPSSPAMDGTFGSIHSNRTSEAMLEPRFRPRSVLQQPGNPARPQTQLESSPFPRASPGKDGMSGKPFIRVGSLDTPLQSVQSSTPRLTDCKVDERPGVDTYDTVDNEQGKRSQTPRQTDISDETKLCDGAVDVAVGLSRLHMVSVPMLQMKPIYWSPVNDIAVVMRATWFYRDTMLPVPPGVANQLEAGYHELRPWSETWEDEIRCAIDVGSLGEEKVSHRLWPQDSNKQQQQGKQSTTEPLISSDPFCSARCFRGEAAAEGCIDLLQGRKKPSGPEGTVRAFSNYHVIYKDAKLAFLLKPTLKPSAYYGRRPLLKIMKGLTVGIPVVRGFDRHTWDRTHKRQASGKPAASAAGESHESTGDGVCPACKADKDRGQVTDLVLVAHGIGQKFAERVESFHFTHAINGFRRAVNIELGDPIVQQVLREGNNGFMILPLNWRMGLSFDDGGPLREEDKSKYTPETFGLKDIEPNTIPAIRSMMSDVMFDIPFYMSHHKDRMINALVSDANRVYRLWCQNNPGFAEKGRVHLIAHSLGSAMAIDILSRQPTTVPRIDLSLTEPETRFFEFDTKNLFLVGSPAGFFLLLERGALMPRRGRLKPGANPDDSVAKNVVAEAGTFGCLAVDNIYNILAKEDPIAYLLNGAVDATYSSSLKVAYVPSTSVSIFKALGDAVRQVVPGMSPAPDALTLEPERPPTVRLPSQLELEVHDFTREDVAEKKAFLLNDNGQIDWYLRSGGGPLEIQYLNMLSAHTSYWTNHDFIRLLCMEIGRKPGRAHTIPAMRAVKATKLPLTTA